VIYAIKIAYDGRDFHGFARQPNVETVEGKILEILKDNDLIKDARSSKFRYASRTDKGVSALGNVIAFNSLKKIELDNLKRLSVENIYFYGLKEVENNFYPRYAKMRWYRYYLKIDADMDMERFLKTASLFTGTHDFSNFARIERNKNPVRKIENILISWIKRDIIAIDFYAQTFLWQQVRRMVIAMEKVAGGLIDKGTVKNALSNPRKKIDLGIAPAQQLILKDVFYDFEFDIEREVHSRSKKIEKRMISSLD